MKKILLIIIASLFFTSVFSQNPITVSGSCTDTDALGTYNYLEMVNGKPKYVKIISAEIDCTVINDAVDCTRQSSLFYTLEWTGTNWEWKKYSGDTCEWSRRKCNQSTTSQTITTLSSNSTDSPLLPCTDWSGTCVPTFSECTTLSVINNSLDKKFTYYPNPINNTFNIKFEAPYDSLNLTLTNVFGQVVMNKTNTNSQMIELNINQPIGIYFIKLTTSDMKEAFIKVTKK